MTPTIPQDIALALPWCAAALAHYFMSDGLAPWKNLLMAIGFVLATALLCIWLSGDFVAGNAQASVMVVLSYVAFLMRGPLAAIMTYFAEIKSPFDPPPANSNPVRVPSALVLPPNVPPRASQPPQGGAASIPVQPPTTPGA